MVLFNKIKPSVICGMRFARETWLRHVVYAAPHWENIFRFVNKGLAYSAYFCYNRHMSEMNAANSAEFPTSAAY